MEDRAYWLTERAYNVAVVLAGIALLCTNVPAFPSTAYAIEVIFMTILVALGEASQIDVANAKITISVSLPIAYTIAVLYGPQTAIWAASIGTLRKMDLQGKVRLRFVLFNRAMIAISMYCFCWIYSRFGGTYGGLVFPKAILPFVLAASVYTLANAITVTLLQSLRFKMSFIDTWRSYIKWSVPNMLAMFPIAIIMILAAQQGSPYLLALFYLPLMVSKYSFDKYAELRGAYREMATALSSAIDARDSYTSGHSQRVADYAGLLAKQLRFHEDEVDILRYVGLLHDVGKVGIRDAIMKKPGTFTYDEYQEMKNHVNIGAEMLEGLKFLGKGQDWVRYHHERYDGKGFPEGLAGEDIPLEARILACADSFDAMTTDRPYKQKMDFEAAKQELRGCSGTQFDPKVVEAMLKVVDKLSADAANALNAPNRK